MGLPRVESPASRQVAGQWRWVEAGDYEAPEAACGRRLETAGNLLCHARSDVVSTVSVVVPLSDRAGEAWRLEALGRRIAAERELNLRTTLRERSITFILSNRV